MSRRKRTATDPLEKARQVLAGLKQINPKPDFGPAGLTEVMFEAELNGYSQDLDAYNGNLAAVDDTANRLNERRQKLQDFILRLQAGIKHLYGPDSKEFELVGGTRRSDRKKRTQTTKAPVTS